MQMISASVLGLAAVFLIVGWRRTRAFRPRSSSHAPPNEDSAGDSVPSNGFLFSVATAAAPAVRQANACRWSQSIRNRAPPPPRRGTGLHRDVASSRGCRSPSSARHLHDGPPATPAAVSASRIPARSQFPFGQPPSTVILPAISLRFFRASGLPANTAPTVGQPSISGQSPQVCTPRFSAH